MFLIRAGTGRDPGRKSSSFEQRCRFNEFSGGGLHLIWLEDGHTSCQQRKSEISISHADPREGTGSAALTWDLNTNRLIVSRPWPGHHSIYIGEARNLIVTSHLKLLSELTDAPGPLPKPLAAGWRRIIDRKGASYVDADRRIFSFEGQAPRSLAEAARLARRALIAAIRKAPHDAALLLSGGIDSSSLAAAARLAGRSPRCYTFAASTVRTADLPGSDLLAARRVAEHLSLDHHEIILEPGRLAENAAPAVFASELQRGTFIDDAVVYLEMARVLARSGTRTILIGEAGDDVFGCLPFRLRFYRGRALHDRLRRNLVRGAPDDHAAIQRIFAFFGIRVIDPYLSPTLGRLGYRLPLDMRIDRDRLMKPVLRRAFAAELPPEIVSRPKHVSRDVSGVREIMEARFGTGRDRYRGIFNSLFRGADAALRESALSALNAGQASSCPPAPTPCR